MSALDFDPWKAAGLACTPSRPAELTGLAVSRTQKLQLIAGARALEIVAIAVEPAPLPTAPEVVALVTAGPGPQIGDVRNAAAFRAMAQRRIEYARPDPARLAIQPEGNME